MGKKKTKNYCCSFCFKSDEDVNRLFVSFQEQAAICDECILLCLKGVFKETADNRKEAVDFKEEN